MGLSKGITIHKLESIQGGMAQFYTPFSSNETMLVEIPAGTIDDLFVHKYQTDQILVVRGSFVLVVLQNRSYQYIPMSEHCPQVVEIPPGIPHGAINLNHQSCLLINGILRLQPAHKRDYTPLKKPFPYDLTNVQKLFFNHQVA